MKATLEFNLPDDNCSFKKALMADEMYSSIVSLDQFLRDGIKCGGYGDAWRSTEDLAAHIRRTFLDDTVSRFEC